MHHPSALWLALGLLAACAAGCSSSEPAGPAGTAGSSAGGANGGSGNPAAGSGNPAAGSGNPAAGSGNSAAGSASGGAGSGACALPASGSCASPTTRITEVALGTPVVSTNAESDTEPLPFAISAIPSGGSRLAWLGTDGQVHVVELDCDDRIVGSVLSFPARDFQDIYADDTGGVLLVARDATGAGADHCGDGPLCGGTTSDCLDMYLVRFEEAGQETWSTKITNTSDSLHPYANGARFLWNRYQHHGRIAYDGANFASYFCIAITAQNGACVDIHEGDRMQVVSNSGSLVEDHPDSFALGCSHSWTTRIVWDPRSNEFVTVCATDNNCRLARPAYETIVDATCDGRFFGGDLVLASDAGYWTSYTSDGGVHLAHFTEAAADRTHDDIGSSTHSHLVAYGAARMIVAWGDDAAITAQVRDAGSGELQGSFSLAVPDHPFQSFKPFPDGSAAFPARGASASSVKIARVMPCAG